ncbi:AAA-ATPase At3g50940-like [Benincasa hispida]|uniref:AAA-ATPase At3g50940-like n=1 Tax=Benincasa hispida TaxID=102211 RepID=UPI001900EC21|nr:AAA-ATPase At3g50940-like [Benincasa hispida]
MPFLANMPSTTSVFSAYTSFAASTMIARTMISETHSIISQFIPQKLRDQISSKFSAIFGSISSQIVLIVEENNGIAINELFRASETYLSTKISQSLKHLKASKAPGETNLTFKMNKGDVLIDVFETIEIAWELISTEKQSTYFDFDIATQTSETIEKRHYQISFDKKHKDLVMKIYLEYILDRAKAIEEENRVVKLYALMGGYAIGDSIVLQNSCSFENLAMDLKKKKELMDDLDRFMRRRDFYKRIGKAWKRGYLLYGPPGTGKSSLVAAMADYLKFNIYDLELTSVQTNSALRTMLLSTADRSIFVIEDIDCSAELHDRTNGGRDGGDSQLTLSGVLNVIDGLWSSCGDARIIVFTTNHKEKLDPALLRPGRMDMHVHMTYLTPSGFEILASNYLQINHHQRFKEIQDLIMEVEVTPAEIAEELMKSDDADVALESVVEFVNGKKKKKMEKECNSDPIENVDGQISRDIEKEGLKLKKRNKRRRNRWSRS